MMNAKLETEQEQHVSSKLKLEQVSVQLTSEQIVWLDNQAFEREKMGLPVSISQLVRECIVKAHLSVNSDTEMLKVIPEKFRVLLSKKTKVMSL